MAIFSLLKVAARALLASTAVYFVFLGGLTIPSLQSHIIYLHRVTLTWFMDVNFPEQWGFLHNQVTPFELHTPDGETLHAWHILPLELYHRNEQALLKEKSGLAPEITTRLGFQLLRDDPQALLIIYLHGAAGTLGSGWRPASYRGMYAGAPDKIHTVAIDYRGYGTSSGVPSEEGLLRDALTLADWAMDVAHIPPSRIVIFGQSLGTAVSISLAHHMVLRSPPILFGGMVLVAPFADVETLTATYRVGGTIPILSPVAHFPKLLNFLNSFSVSKWPSKDTLARFVRTCETMRGEGFKYHITLIHAEDDHDIPWSHSETVFWHAVNASLPTGISYEELEKEKESLKSLLGAGGWFVEKRSDHGVIREEIVKHGLHDKIMSYPVVSLAVRRAFRGAEEFVTISA
jgi:abhydrolase domain-containing protein 12